MMIELSTTSSFSRESLPGTTAPPLRVAQRVLTAACRHARSAAPNECMGLLGSRKRDRSGVVTGSVIDWDQNVLGGMD